jgi:hypothetical protein
MKLPRIRLAWAGCALLWLATGCTPPTRALLTSRCPEAGSAADDPSCRPPGLPCLDDSQCPSREWCSAAGSCKACMPTPPGCPDCPNGVLTKRAANGCVVCECGQECKGNLDCAKGSLCVGGVCAACATVPASCPSSCPWDFEARPVSRNACASCECVPPNQCLRDADCPSGQQCYAGSQCQDGCTTPECCFGNFCAAPGCKGLPKTSCALIGCAQGTCAGTCAGKPVCECLGNPLQWTCADTGCDATLCK